MVQIVALKLSHAIKRKSCWFSALFYVGFLRRHPNVYHQLIYVSQSAHVSSGGRILDPTAKNAIGSVTAKIENYEISKLLYVDLQVGEMCRRLIMDITWLKIV